MKNKIIVTILIIFTFSYILGNTVYSSYKKEIMPNNTIYYLETETKNIDSSYRYITISKNNSDLNYIGMTTDYQNAKKIIQIFKEKNIDIKIKEDKTDNMEFYNELIQYDILLKNTSDYNEINNVLSTILSTYEEILQFEEEF